MVIGDKVLFLHKRKLEVGNVLWLDQRVLGVQVGKRGFTLMFDDVLNGITNEAMDLIENNRDTFISKATTV